MNCCALALPTFCEPGAVVSIVTGVAPVAAVADDAGELATDVVSAEAAPVTVKPQPCLPESKATATAEQTPLGLAQHADAQSASLKHWPVINCWPFAFPTF